jgi:predicted dehydrogenase
VSEVLRIGVLGTARIAERALLRPAREVAAVAVTAVAARDASRAGSFALQHGIPTAHDSYDDLLADPDIDAVYVPSPNSLHAPWTLRAIEAGKHVLCEKPFASNAAEAEEVAAAAADSGLVVMEAMHYQYHPLVQRMTELVRGGMIGAVRHVQCWTSWPIPDLADIRYDYPLGGGALMDGGCYAIDCLRLVGGAASVTGALADPLPSPQHLVDRAMAVRLEFADGATGWLESAFTREGEFRADVHVIGETGQLWLRNFILAHEGHLIVTRNGTVLADEGPADPTDEHAADAGDTTFAWQLRAFAAAAGDGEPFPTTAASAAETMRLIDEAYQAAGLPPRGCVEVAVT